MTRLARLSLRFRTVTLLMVAMLLVAGVSRSASWIGNCSHRSRYPTCRDRDAARGRPQRGGRGRRRPDRGRFLSTSNLEHVQSTSLEGLTIVSASYEFGTDMEAVLTEIGEL